MPEPEWSATNGSTAPGDAAGAGAYTLSAAPTPRVVSPARGRPGQVLRHDVLQRVGVPRRALPPVAPPRRRLRAHQRCPERRAVVGRSPRHGLSPPHCVVPAPPLPNLHPPLGRRQVAAARHHGGETKGRRVKPAPERNGGGGSRGREMREGGGAETGESRGKRRVREGKRARSLSSGRFGGMPRFRIRANMLFSGTSGLRFDRLTERGNRLSGQDGPMPFHPVTATEHALHDHVHETGSTDVLHTQVASGCLFLQH